MPRMLFTAYGSIHHYLPILPIVDHVREADRHSHKSYCIHPGLPSTFISLSPGASCNPTELMLTVSVPATFLRPHHHAPRLVRSYH